MHGESWSTAYRTGELEEMSLRLKTILILLMVFVLYGALTYLVQQKVVFPSFVALEQEEAEKNMHRILGAIDREIEVLRASANDWSIWDDTHDYLQDGNQEYEEDNLGLDTLAGMHLNLMSLYDREGKLVWGRGYDLGTGEELSVGALSQAQLPQDHVLLAGPLAEEKVGGIYLTELGPMLVVANPVFKHTATAPAGGALLMGRLLNDEAVERLAEQAQLTLKMTPVSDQDSPIQWASNAAELVPNTSFVLEAGEKAIDVSTVIGDIGRKPAVRAEVQVPRDITARGQEAMLFALVSLIGVGVVVLLVLLALLQRTVFRPVTLLTKHAVRIGEQGDLSTRIALDRRDEIGILACELDQMVERLAEARKDLLEQSYYAGIAETASAVLHNIGNAVTPLYIKLSSAKEQLKNAPLEGMEKAIGELTDEATAQSRREPLSRYVGLAGKQLATQLREAQSTLQDVGAQMMHVQQILNDQQQLSRAKPVLEALEMQRIIDDAIKFLPDSARNSTSITVDEQIRGIGAVRAARVALQQVVSNLVLNAAEAIAARADSAEPGRIEVFADIETEDGEVVGHFRFGDNGVGIDPDQIKSIFERGFSTKARGSGLGLHWSANTVAAMGGRVFAESAGLGRGATVHLVLPLANSDSETLRTAA